MNREYLDTVWRNHRRLGKWRFVWKQRIAPFYAPSLLVWIAFVTANYAESFIHGLRLALIVSPVVAGGALLLGHFEWEAREEQFKELEK